MVPGLECLEVGDIKRCVAPCQDDEECEKDKIMPGTRCIGVSTTSNFCIEEIPP